MSYNSRTIGKARHAWLVGLGILLVGLIVACGSPTAPTDSGESTSSGETAPAQEQAVAQPEALAIPATQAPAQGSAGSAAPAASSGSGSQPAPTAMAQPTPAPQEPAVSAKDTVIIITNEEPTTIGAASANCGGNIQNTICDDMASDPLTCIDDLNGLSGGRTDRHRGLGTTGARPLAVQPPGRRHLPQRRPLERHPGQVLD